MVGANCEGHRGLAGWRILGVPRSRMQGQRITNYFTELDRQAGILVAGNPSSKEGAP
jgi:hypothetical protein